MCAPMTHYSILEGVIETKILSECFLRTEQFKEQENDTTRCCKEETVIVSCHACNLPLS